jgi:ubiquinone/menaquinone biosynthesis C-methylase UbiE
MNTKLTSKDILKMSYVQFIAFLKETNRCPGGKKSIRLILQNTFANSNSRILEIGSNTGFTSLEIARITAREVIGIEPIQEAVDESNNLLMSDTQEIQQKVRFLKASAYDIPFTKEAFDIVIAGGATSFMENKNKAINEYYRVLKPWGFLSISNLYYRQNPPKDIVSQVSEIIATSIKPWGINEWRDLFLSQNLFELYHIDTHNLIPVNYEEILNYVEIFINKPHIQNLSTDTKETIRKRWIQTITVFNENIKYLGFFIAIFRKRYLSEEPELFRCT